MRLLRLLLPLCLAACAATAPAAEAPPPRVALRELAMPGPEGVSLRAVLALPDGPATGAAIIALHGCSGLAPPGMPLRLPARERDWAARLTAAGHPVLFPDSLGSRGFGPVCGAPGTVEPRTVRRADAHAAAAWAVAQPWAPPGGVVLLGWSHGGSTTLAAMGGEVPAGLFRAAIAFYPGCGRFPGWRPAAPTLLLLGGADDWTAPGPCRRLAASAGAEAETYPGAAHGFDHPNQALRGRTLPNGRVVTTGTDPAGRQAAIARVAGFLAAHGRVAH